MSRVTIVFDIFKISKIYIRNSNVRIISLTYKLMILLL